jgi:hypothetical protein
VHVFVYFIDEFAATVFMRKGKKELRNIYMCRLGSEIRESSVLSISFCRVENALRRHYRARSVSEYQMQLNCADE